MSGGGGWRGGALPDEEPPQRPREDEDDAQDPALRDEEGDGQQDGVGVVLHHDQELRHRDGGHQPRLLTQLLMELPADGGRRGMEGGREERDGGREGGEGWREGGREDRPE